MVRNCAQNCRNLRGAYPIPEKPTTVKRGLAQHHPPRLFSYPGERFEVPFHNSCLELSRTGVIVSNLLWRNRVCAVMHPLPREEEPWVQTRIFNTMPHGQRYQDRKTTLLTGVDYTSGSINYLRGSLAWFQYSVRPTPGKKIVTDSRRTY